MSLSDLHRSLLARLADTIVPRSEGRPSAGDILRTPAALDRVLLARPDLLAPLIAVIQEFSDQPSLDFLDRLSTHHPRQFSALMQVVAAAYYLDDGIRKAVDCAGQFPPGRSDKDAASPAFTQRDTRDHTRPRPH
jgi:hypothetical protein